MDLSSGDISTLIFKPVVRDDLGNFSLDGHMLSVLMALNGKRTLGQVAQQAGLNMATMRDATSKLVDLKLIESVKSVGSVLDQDFMSFLISELSIAIGPLGEVIVEDGLEDLGFTVDLFALTRPLPRAELVVREVGAVCPRPTVHLLEMA